MPGIEPGPKIVSLISIKKNTKQWHRMQFVFNTIYSGEWNWQSWKQLQFLMQS